jgi:tetratricopeptide (TPR) repeat protein
MEHTSKKLHILLICLALVLVTLVAFEQVRLCEFTFTDDVKFAAANPHVQAGLTRKSVAYAFTTTTTANWMPLTWLSVMLDSQVFGPSSTTFHLMNLFYHLLTVLLLFMVLNRMTGALWRSAFVAAAFAVHPLRVESVAWIAERKDVLSGVFWMLTMLAYIRYAQRPNVRRYLPVALALTLGLMAKPMLVTLPCILLLLDYWPLGRLRWDRQNAGQELPDSESAGLTCKKTSLGRLIAEKLPLFILVVASCIITFIAQQAEGAVKSLDRVPLGVRLNNALVSYIAYIGKMIWPTRLAVLYPHPGHNLPAWKTIIALLMLISVSAGLIYMARRRHDMAPLVVGWLWYIGTLVPVIGLVQVGAQSMADRYTYLPSIGILIMVAWGPAKLAEKLKYKNIILGLSSASLLVTLTLCTRMQVEHWKNSSALFRHTLEVTSNNYSVHYSYAVVMFSDGYLDEAALHFQKSLRINPGFKKSYDGLSKLLYKQRKFDETIALCKKRLRIGKPDPAIYHRLGMTYLRKGEYPSAIKALKQAVQLKPESAGLHKDLAEAIVKLGNPDVAIKILSEVIELNPNVAPTHNALAQALKSKGRIKKAIFHFGHTVRLQPSSVEALNSAAWIFATHSDPNIADSETAINIAERACELTDYQDPGSLDTLAAAYAAAGRFADAVATAEKALQIIASGDKKERAGEVQSRLELYKQQKPYIQPRFRPV